ncbi:MAG: PKD domain-containing protein [Pseudomonadota bacterium]
MFRTFFASLMVALCLIHAQDTLALERIVFSPASPKVNGEITFKAVGWDTTGCILWIFGDGDLSEDARDPYTTTHSYAVAGTYTVMAYMGCDPSATPVTTTVRVGEAPAVGPAAPFGVSFVQLRFKDGKAYSTVPRNTPDLHAYADIKYEGTGIIRFQWLVDGKPFETQSQNLFFARQTIVQTTKPLPSRITGVHDVSLRILHPQVAFTVPVIRYFVSLGEEQAAPPASTIDLFVTSALDQDGKPLEIVLGELRAPAEEQILMAGSVVNNHDQALTNAKLDIYLEDRLVDSQVIREIPARNGKSFETSFFNPSNTRKTARLILEDASGRSLKTATLVIKPVSVGLAQLPLPPGVFIGFRARPRTIQNVGTEKIVLEYHVENVTEAIIFVQWTYEKKGWWGPYMEEKYANLKTLNPKKDQGRMLESLPEIHMEGYEYTPGLTPETYRYGIHGKYYDPATGKDEDFMFSEALKRYVTVEGFEPTVLIKDWKYVENNTLTVGEDGTALVGYNNADPVTVTLNLTLENPQRMVRPNFGVCQDVGVFSVPVLDLPSNCTTDDITVYGLDGCATRTISHNITFPPGLLKGGEKITRLPFRIEVDPMNRFPPVLPGEDKKRQISGVFRLTLPKPKEISFTKPVIKDFSADIRTMFIGGTSTISWNVDHVNGGGIAEVDSIGGQPGDTITDLNITSYKSGDGYDHRGRGSITVSPQKTTLYALYAYLYTDTPSGAKPVVRYLTISAVAKGSFAGEKPLIQSFSADKATVKANEPVKLTYEFSFAGAAKIVNKANERLIEDILVVDPGKVVSGSVEVMPDVMTTYELVCSNPNGDERKSVTVTVMGAGMGGIADPNKP